MRSVCRHETPSLAYTLPFKAHYAYPLPTGAHPLNPNPDNADNNIQALALPAIILVAPHAVPLLVPVRPGGGVHAPPPDVGLPVGGDGALAAVLALGLRGRGVGALGLVELRGGDQVLDYGRVDGELVGGGRVLGGRF